MEVGDAEESEEERQRRRGGGDCRLSPRQSTRCPRCGSAKAPRSARVLTSRLGEIAALAQRAEACAGPAAGGDPRPARRTGRRRCLAQSDRFDPDRLHQEAILIATKADVREELDRLAAHVAQARLLIDQGGAIGRRLDFLAQELNREANTLCAKANDVELTNIGLELKAAVEQFREQVQNVE